MGADVAPGSQTPIPQAPGRLGQRLETDAVRQYLGQLQSWFTDRRAELDQLDAASLAAADPGQHLADLTVAMAAAASLEERIQGLLDLWDSGRVNPQILDQLSVEIWGRLRNSSLGGLGVSVPEACRILDALCLALRTRLDFDPARGAIAARLDAVEAGIERCAQGHADAGLLADLTQALSNLRASHAARRDVALSVAALEGRQARAERDLIVASAKLAATTRSREKLVDQRQQLIQRAQAAHQDAAACLATIADPPRLGIPDVTVLGDVPPAGPELARYGEQLDRASAALSLAEAAYRAPVSERADLLGLLGAMAAKAEAKGVAQHPAVAAALAAAKAAVRQTPCHVVAARERVQDFQQAVNLAIEAGAPIARPQPEETNGAAV